jgi:hypothetical protein
VIHGRAARRRVACLLALFKTFCVATLLQRRSLFLSPSAPCNLHVARRHGRDGAGITSSDGRRSLSSGFLCRVAIRAPPPGHVRRLLLRSIREPQTASHVHTRFQIHQNLAVAYNRARSTTASSVSGRSASTASHSFVCLAETASLGASVVEFGPAHACASGTRSCSAGGGGASIDHTAHGLLWSPLL